MKKITRKSWTINAVGGDRGYAIHRTRSVTRQISSQKNCVYNLFVALAQLAGTKTKVDYLLDSIERASRQGSLENHPTTIAQWKALFAANKFRIAHDDALKASLLDPNEYGSIAQLSQEARSAMLLTGKSLENKIGTRGSSSKDILKELSEVFRNNVDYAFINIQDNGLSGLEGKLDENIWKPEADLLFSGESDKVYNLDNIEESRILQEPPIKVKLKFGNQAPKATRVLLARLWNFFFEVNPELLESRDAYFDKKLGELCKGWRLLGRRKIIKIIERLSAVYEERFTALIPYLPADMFKDTPEGDPDYDVVVPESYGDRALYRLEEEEEEEEDDGSINDEGDTGDEGDGPDVESGYIEFFDGLSEEEQIQVSTIYPRLMEIFRERAFRGLYGSPSPALAQIHADADTKFEEILTEMRDAEKLTLLKDLLVVMRDDVLSVAIPSNDLYRSTINDYLAVISVFAPAATRTQEEEEDD